ncbi:MAG: Holliday junction resolvase RuvX [Candidatus Kerfeldbacteria bacterium]|jgi:putative pre-16S rRNA nuclease
MSKILGIDYGGHRMGLAISDEGWQYAFIFKTLDFTSKTLMKDLVEICHDEKVKKIILGLPLNQHGEVGPKAQEVTDWAKEVEMLLKIPIIFEDERFTSVMSKKLLHNSGRKKKRPKGDIDQQSARLILQAYLDKQHG